ncbi:SpoIIE family protein phosphatase [Actinoallomurus bryophytorum]|uniref:Stage II sporulation protein E n=1 Tax=Actinoallomurus bryophytorum TaxID=1490222 RepID=A0A543CR84_9ACTN|nr:SpoIIE family protein phosphatase [Actinoallomurus bryophytorum]TQL99604.1 stage II sporulation protein E [Actinoallomurus bryophytorum]
MTVTEAWDLTVADEGQVHGATAAASAAALAAGLDPGEVATCERLATELATNLVRHAVGGRLLVSVAGKGAVQIVAVDRGPGIDDAAVSRIDGRTTGTSLGAGLDACRREAAQFDLYSRPGQGTVVLARVGPAAAEPAGPVEFGGIITPHPDESAVGDGFGLAWEGERMTIGVVDGLGHGVEAAEARQAALERFEQRPARDSAGLLREIDVDLRVTRGAAAAVAQIDGRSRQLTFAGMGNVTGRLFRPGNAQTLVSRPGILGAGHGIGAAARPRLHRLVAADWLAPAVLVMHTDGVTNRWDPADHPGADNHHPAILAALIWRDALRGNDDATVVVARTSPENGLR